MGAWIEIGRGLLLTWIDIVAPLVGAWIEITIIPLRPRIRPVAPLVGAWIEITVYIASVSPGFRRTPRGCVD